MEGREIQLSECATVFSNESAALLDLGDGIACLEFRTKGHAVSSPVADVFGHALDHEMKDFRGLLVANQGKNFSVGADLNVTRDDILAQKFDAYYESVKNFQAFNQRIKQYEKPIVCAPYRRTLGGGLETTMHCHARVVRADLMAGLVEAGVGLIPGGGGIKESLVNATESADVSAAVKTIFLNLIFAKTSANAEEAMNMYYLHPQDVIVAAEAPLIALAKERCITLAEEAAPPQSSQTVRYLGAPGFHALMTLAEQLRREGALTPFSFEIATIIATVLTGGTTYAQATDVPEETVWEQERKGFSELVRSPKTLERIEHVLTTGQLLKN